MDSILEFEASEIAHIQEQIGNHVELWKENYVALFEDCFLLLTSTSAAKPENFKIMRQLQATAEDEAEVESQSGLSALFDVILNVCGQVFKMGVEGQEEF